MVLKEGVNDADHKWVVEEASKRASVYQFNYHILPPSTGDLLECALPHLVSRGMWEAVGKVLEKGVSDPNHRWVVKKASRSAEEQDFFQFILNYSTGNQLECALPYLVSRGMWEIISEVLKKNVCTEQLGWTVSEYCEICRYTAVMGKAIRQLRPENIETLLKSVSSNTLPPAALSVALRFALQQNKWDVISQACLSHVWEQVRRELFRAAVEQQRWRIVEKWADHKLYLNQRWWALQEAYKHK
jgi:hypothetical protein